MKKYGSNWIMLIRDCYALKRSLMIDWQHWLFFLGLSRLLQSSIIALSIKSLLVKLFILVFCLSGLIVVERNYKWEASMKKSVRRRVWLLLTRFWSLIWSKLWKEFAYIKFQGLMDGKKSYGRMEDSLLGQFWPQSESKLL